MTTVYVIHVTWSDGTTSVIFRRYSRFFDLQCKLLDMFPIESGVVDPSQRIIPFLPGKIIFGRSQIRDVALKRMPQIDSYCKTLVSLNTKISQSDEVIDFFEMEPEDWNPPKEGSSGSIKVKADKISKPKLSEQYICIADYEKEAKGEVNLKAGVKVEVIEKDESGWWFVNAEDEQGWVPSTYLEREDGVQEVVARRAKPGEEEKYICTESITPQGVDELSLEKGAVVEVLEKRLDGWWLVRYKEKEGLAPGMYLAKTETVQSQNLSKMAQAPGVQIVSSLSDVSNLFRKSDDFEEGNRQSSPRGASVAVMLKSRSLERKSAVKPPPRQNSKSSLINRSSVNRQSAPDKTLIGYTTLADFEDKVGDGISFKQGEDVTILEKSDSGWWCVRIGDKEGWAPSSYIGEQMQDLIYESIADVEEDPMFDTTEPTAQQQNTSFADQLKNKMQNRNSPNVSVNKENENNRTVSESSPQGLPKIGTVSMADELKAKLKPAVSPSQTSTDSKRRSNLTKPSIVSKNRPHSGDFTDSKEDSSELSNLLKSKFEARNRAFSSDEDLSSKTGNENKSKGSIPSKPLVFPPKTNSDKNSNTQGEHSTKAVKPALGLKPKPAVSATKPSIPSQRPSAPAKPKDIIKPSAPAKPVIGSKKPTFSVNKNSQFGGTTKSDQETPPQTSGGIASVLSKFQSPSSIAERPSHNKSQNKPKISSMASKFENKTKPAVPQNRPSDNQKPKTVHKPNNSTPQPPKTTTWNVNASKKKAEEEDIPKPNIANLRNALKSKLETSVSPVPVSVNSDTKKNSVKSSSIINNEAKPPKQEHVSSSSSEAKCFVTCAAFTGQSDGELTFNEGETVDVIDKMDGWWLVTINGVQGYAPADYITEVSNVGSSQGDIMIKATTDTDSPTNIGQQKCITITSFYAENDGEASFDEGMEVTLLQEDDGGWWLIEVNGQEGWAPSDYLQLL